jgi:hypothetical protein
MRKDAVEEFIKKSNVSKNFILSLIESESIKLVQYEDNIYYLKNLRR